MFKIQPFNDHQNCKGHANMMLDSTYETKQERQSFIKVLDHYIKSYEKELATEKNGI